MIAAPVVVPTDPWLATSNRNELRAKILAEFDAGHRHIVVDCALTGYLESSVTGMFLRLTREIEAQGGSLTLSHLTREQREYYASAKLDTRLRIDAGER